jgi:aquaporin Z
MNNKLKMEFIGTFFLVLVVAFTGNPLAIGAVLAALVYMGGYISGGHFNPAVTTAVWINEKMKKGELLRYIGIQLLAGIAAAGVYHVIAGTRFVPQVPTNADLSSAFLVEVLFTFLLATVVLHTGCTDKTKGNNYFGMAIGFSLLAGVYVGLPISGAAYNPAVGMAPLIYDFNNWSTHLVSMSIYLFGPMIGGILAGLVYKSFETKNKLIPW